MVGKHTREDERGIPQAADKIKAIMEIRTLDFAQDVDRVEKCFARIRICSGLLTHKLRQYAGHIIGELMVLEINFFKNMMHEV